MKTKAQQTKNKQKTTNKNEKPTHLIWFENKSCVNIIFPTSASYSIDDGHVGEKNKTKQKQTPPPKKNLFFRKHKLTPTG